MTTQIPFWLQVTSITIAPALALMGVFVGAGAKSRFDKAAELRKDRRGTYTQFLTKADKLSSFITINGPTIVEMFAPASDLENAGPDRIRRARDNYQRIADELMEVSNARLEVDLIGSPDVASAAGPAFVTLTTMAAALTTQHADEEPASRLSKLTEELNSHLTRFRDAAFSDLDIPRAERERRDNFSVSTTVAKELEGSDIKSRPKDS